MKRGFFMTSKPENFSLSTILEESVSPKDLDAWIHYAYQEYFSKLLQFNENISDINDLKLEIKLVYPFYYSASDYVKASICCTTTIPNLYSISWNIANFKHKTDGVSTFENYINYKNITEDITNRFYIENIISENKCNL